MGGPRRPAMTNPVLCLSIHADYRCRRAGACCTSAWPIPVEAALVGVLRRAITDGTLRVPNEAAGAGDPFTVDAMLPPGVGAVLRPGRSGACSFYDRESGLCAIQRVLGHEALPSSCQHFPRVCVIDRDATFVSLSHYCPTAARLLFREDVPLAVVPAPHDLAGRIRLEGLDAREALPPLILPGLLADREGYRAWEDLVVSTMASEVSPEEALDRVGDAAERVRSWKPGDGALRDAVASIVASPDACTPPTLARATRTAARAAARFEVARRAVPPGLDAPRPPEDVDDLDAAWVAPRWGAFARPVRRYLAARAFGNWCAYQGPGLRTIVELLETALAVVRVEAARHCGRAGRVLDEALLLAAIRAADLLLVHLASPDVLAAQLGAVENH
jgi:hypothetical protein